MGSFYTKNIAIVVATYDANNRVYVGCHFENSVLRNRHKKLSLCAGHVDKGETFIHGAIREAREEHGLHKDERDLRLIHTRTKNNTTYKYYTIDVLPSDYYTHKIETHNEIITDQNIINDMLRHFPSGSVLNTGSDSTFLVDVDVFKMKHLEKYLYEPTIIFINKYFK